MFGCAADLNTLIARQLKSTFGTQKVNTMLLNKRTDDNLKLEIFSEYTQGILYDLLRTMKWAKSLAAMQQQCHLLYR